MTDPAVLLLLEDSMKKMNSDLQDLQNEQLLLAAVKKECCKNDTALMWMIEAAIQKVRTMYNQTSFMCF